MKKKIFQRILTAVLSAALLLTSNGMASVNAAEKIYVDGVYTNFQKASMAIGTTKQINAYVEPANATVQKLMYSSSKAEVATVTSTGLITAVSPGTTIITVKALDGSSQEETIEVTVLEDLFLTKANVDKDKEIVLIDKSYGNITIDSSVGSASIYLSNITVRNELRLDEGKYKLHLYDSKINKMIVDDFASEIESLSSEEKKDLRTPTLHVMKGSNVASASFLINCVVTQGDGSKIEGISLSESSEGKLLVTINNYEGDIKVDSSFGDVELVLNNSKVQNLNVAGKAHEGSVVVKGDATFVENVNLAGGAKVDLSVPTENIIIEKDALDAKVKTFAAVGTVTNHGSRTNMNIANTLVELITTGDNGYITVGKDSSIELVTVIGNNTEIHGDGAVTQIDVEGNHTRIYVLGAVASIGENASGTVLAGAEASAGSRQTVTIPDEDRSEEKEGPQIGDIILFNNFEDGRNGIVSVQGTLDTEIVDGGVDGGKALKVSGKTDTWNGVGFNFNSYLKQYITVNVKADIKATRAGTVKASMVLKDAGVDSWATIATVDNAEVDKWYTLEGSFELLYNYDSAAVFFETPETHGEYYLDNVTITISHIGRPIPVVGVTLNKDEVYIPLDGEYRFTETVLPLEALNRDVIWYIDDSSVATIDPVSGVIKAKNVGETRVTVQTKENYMRAHAIIKVLKPEDMPVIPEKITYDFESNVPTIESIGIGKGQVVTMDEMIEDIMGSYTMVPDNMMKVTNGGYNSIPIYKASLPEGTTLSDYDELRFSYYTLPVGDSQYKEAFFFAGDSIASSMWLDNDGNHTNLITKTGYGDGFTSAGSWNNKALIINKEKAAEVVTGSSFEIAVGMNSPEGVTYYISDMYLVKDGVETKITSFDQESPIRNFGTITAISENKIGFIKELYLTNPSTGVLKVSGFNWDDGSSVKLTANLVPKTSLKDYASLSFDLFLPTTEDGGFYYKDLRVLFGPDVNSAADEACLLETYKTEGNQGKWITRTYIITDEMREAAGDDLAFDLLLNLASSTSNSFYIDNVTLIPR